MTKVHQARQMFFIRLGLNEAFKADALSSVRVGDFHIKYLGEARPDDPLYIETGLLELGESDVRLCHMMFHADRRIAATVVERVEHISLRTKSIFPWTDRFRKATKTYTVEQPQPSKPRGLSYEDPSAVLTETKLKKLGVPHAGSGVFQPNEMGLDGYATPQALLGRCTETVSHVTDGYPEFLDPAYHDGTKSGALLEARIFLHHPAESGDGYHFYSGLQKGDTYTRNIVHNCVNTVTGENIFSMLGIGCLFDLKARKLIKASKAQVATLQENVIKNLTV